MLIASGLLLIDPGTLTDIAGIGIILLIYFIQKALREADSSHWIDGEMKSIHVEGCGGVMSKHRRCHNY